jgi:hypothetical protein
LCDGGVQETVGFVHDDKVPPYLPETRQNLTALGQVERRDNLRALKPLIDAVLFANVAALQRFELLIEFVPEFALPLERETPDRRSRHAR